MQIAWCLAAVEFCRLSLMFEWQPLFTAFGSPLPRNVQGMCMVDSFCYLSGSPKMCLRATAARRWPSLCCSASASRLSASGTFNGTTPESQLVVRASQCGSPSKQCEAASTSANRSQQASTKVKRLGGPSHPLSFLAFSGS